MNTKSLQYRDICCSCFRNSDAKQSVHAYLGNGQKVSSIFLVMTGIDILQSDSADFTDSMCLECLVIVRSFFDFREKCLETQRKFAKLREEVTEEKLQAEVNDDLAAASEVTDMHKCSHCTESFSREVSLKRHIKECHKAKIELSCDICSLKFKLKSKLLAHMLQHRREKSFTC